MDCEKFDDFSKNRCLILPNLASTILNNEKVLNIIEDMCSRDPKSRNPKNSWFIHGSLGDFANYPNFRKGLRSGYTVSDAIAQQNRVTKKKLSEIRKEVCGEYLEGYVPEESTDDPWQRRQDRLFKKRILGY